jgi:hypothetical protein
VPLFPPLSDHLFALDLTHRLVAMADALLDMVNIDLRLLLVPLLMCTGPIADVLCPRIPPAPQAPPLQHCPGNVTHLRSWWIVGLQDTQTLSALTAVVPANRPFEVAISPNPTWTACRALQIAQPLPPPTLVPPVPGATLKRPSRPYPRLPVIFPGCTSSSVCSCALQDRGALPSSNFV